MRPSKLISGLLALAVLAILPTTSSLSAQSQGEGMDQPIAVMVELGDPPAAVVYAERQQQVAIAAAAAADAAAVPAQAAAATAAGRAQLATIAGAQAMLQQQLATLDTPVLFSVKRVYNGVAVVANEAQRAAIAQLPGVKAVHPLIPKEPSNSISIPFLGVPALWQTRAALGSAAGLRGEGMRIAIIDTGIDYLHRDFGGPGTGYLENDRTRIGDIQGFPGLRVVGGYDFAGDNYNASARANSGQFVPRPDPDPMDCYGHGTHVAGTAGGSGVTDARTTYAGPYDASTDYAGLYIGPGVAPRASLYALKIFGCYGSTNLTDLALEWAVDPNQDGDFGDHMDVANLSLGSAYGWEYDTSTVAADNAALVGVIVVASAGNSGDIQFITSAPAIAERAISTAATQHAADVAATFSARGPRRGDAALKPDLAAPGMGIVSADAGSGSDRSSSSGTSMAAPHVSGMMALLRQVHPTWSVEELKALAMNTAMPLVGRGEGTDAQPLLPVLIGAGRIDPPAAATANAVFYAADSSGRVSLSFGAPEVDPRAQDEYNSTREVEIANRAAIPAAFDVTYSSFADLPGVSVQVPSRPVVVAANGKVRVPVTLRVDAAKFQRRQAPADAGNYLLDTWFAEEGGHLFLWPSGPLQTTVMQPEPWGTQTGGSTPGTATLQSVYAPRAHTLAYTITLSGMDATAITSATLGYGRPGNASMKLADLPAMPQAGGLITGSLVLDADGERWLAAGLLHLGLANDQPGGELRGQLVYPQPVLHLPLYAAPRLVASMGVEPQALTFVSGTVEALTFAGNGLEGSAPPTDVVSLAAVMELKLRSPNTRPSWLEAGMPDRYDHADLQYVGVTSDAGLGLSTPAADRIYFGVAMWAPWSTPNEIKVNVLLDTNGDGEYEYRLANGVPTAPIFGSGPVGPLVSELYDIATGEVTAQQPLNGVAPVQFDANPFFSNVMVLPVKAADLGLNAARGAINFMVQTTSADTLDSDKYVDRSPVMRYDPARPALLFSVPTAAAPLYRDRPGAAIEVKVNPAGYPFSQPAGILIFHHHNHGGSHASVVNISYRWPSTIYLPVIDQGARP